MSRSSRLFSVSKAEGYEHAPLLSLMIGNEESHELVVVILLAGKSLLQSLVLGIEHKDGIDFTDGLPR